VHVAGRYQVAHFLRGPITLINRDRISLGPDGHRREILSVRFGVDTFDDESGAVVRPECFSKRVNHGEGVFPLEVAVKIENEEINNLFGGYAQPAAALVS